MLILEGPDHIGKTTAAKRMVDMMKHTFCDITFGNEMYQKHLWRAARYQHMSRPIDGFNFASHYVDMMSVEAIQDRFHLGSLVYHEDVMRPEVLRVIEGELLRRGSFIVVFIADPEDYEKRLRTNPKQEMFSIADCMKYNLAFKDMCNGEPVQCCRPVIDVVWDVSEYGYPQDDVLQLWLKQWLLRVKVCSDFSKA